jgi:hypothetical protein
VALFDIGPTVTDLLRESVLPLRAIWPNTEKLNDVLTYLRARVKLMDYGRWKAADLVIASRVVEGAARYVVGERLDNSGMRWVEERAEAVLLLRCIEVNGDWEDFMEWSQAERSEQLRRGTVLQIRSKVPTQLPVAA